MANASSEKVEEKAPSLFDLSVVAPAVGWLIPGAGHLVQKRWIRGLILMICVAVMYFLGVAMEGKIYKPNTGELLDILGFVGDIGAGGLYLLGRMAGRKPRTGASAREPRAVRARKLRPGDVRS